jgi:polyketide biosynthesis acyl carrier protein
MTRDAVFALVRNQLLVLFPDLADDEIRPESSMRALGINSLDRADVIVSTLHLLHTDLPMNEFARARSLGELSEMIHQRLDTRA